MMDALQSTYDIYKTSIIQFGTRELDKIQTKIDTSASH